MAITRYENVKIKSIANSKNSIGEYTTTLTDWFESRALVSDVSNSLRISDRYRIYSDLVHLTFNYTPNMRTIVDNQNLYSLEWRGYQWRITDVRESNDRMNVTFTCYRNDPTTPV
jgi:hypothetical protein